MRLHWVFMTAATGALAFTSIAQAKLGKTGESSVSFTALGPGGMKIVGTTADLTVHDDGETLFTQVPLSNLSTGIGLRDKHMREKYLETQTYPNAELRVRRAAIKFPVSSDTSGDAPGTLTIHGKEKPVTFQYSARRGAADQIHVEGTVHVNMHDFGIEVPSYLGVTVRPEVDITARFDVEDR